MSKFYIPSASESVVSTPAYEQSIASDADDDDLDTLPYPAELPRNDFLVPSFDAQTYLSTLRNRHQTLEDLRADLRQRSQLLSQELLDLVNGNYEEFLGLGSDLRGGEDKIEGVRLGLLGFQREIAGVKKGVKRRADEVQALLRERKAIRREVMTGRNLLEIGDRVAALERRLGTSTDINDEDPIEGFDDDLDESTVNTTPVHRLRRLAEQYLLISQLAQRVGLDQPYLVALGSRIDGLRKTILLDLAAALRNAKAIGDSRGMVSVMTLFEDLHAEKEGIRVLRGG